MSGGLYQTAPRQKRRVPRITSSSQQLKRVRPYVEEKPMKLTIKQRIRNWLMNDEEDNYQVNSIDDENGPDLNSQSFRLNVYNASGGTIVETTKYDRKSDENRHSLHVVTADKDLGEELSKIITMESLR
jgi:hypothetical protein